MSKMVEPRTWEEFREASLLWWVNRILHLFGWAIVYELEDGTEKLVKVYPARVKFRGFDEKSEEEGFKKLSKYIEINAKQILKETEE